jgi:antitoxin MazE
MAEKAERPFMKTTIRKIDRRTFVVVPRSMLSRIGAKAHDLVDIKVEGKRLVITASSHDPRAGWADESKAIAAAGEDKLVWPDFGKDSDKYWKW